MGRITYTLVLFSLSTIAVACTDRAVGFDRYVFVCGGADQVHIFSLGNEERKTTTIPSASLAVVTRYRWSPDGYKILIDDRYVLWLDLLEATEFPLPGLLRGWSNDGEWVWLYDRNTGSMYQVRPDGTDSQAVAEIVAFNPSDHDDLRYGPYISPTGDRMIWYGVNPETHDSTGPFIRDLPFGISEPLRCDGVGPTELAGAYDDDVLWHVGGQSLILRRGGRSRIDRCDLATGQVSTVAESLESMIGYVKLSPNGRYIAYDTMIPTDGFQDLHLVDLDSGHIDRLTEGWNAVLAAWTYDSEYVIFSGEDPHHAYGYYAVSPTGNEVNRVTFPESMCLSFEPCPVPRSLSEFGE